MNMLFLMTLLAAKASAAEPIGSPARWLSPDDYPATALRDNVEGRAVAVFTISTEGTVAKCEIRETSGSPLLDDTTCRLVSERARFTPATNRRGRAIASRKQMSFKWVIPTEADEINYPALAAMDMKVTFEVTPEGLIENCRELSMEGVPAVAHICDDMTSRARFRPPVNASGLPVRRRVTLSTMLTIEDPVGPN